MTWNTILMPDTVPVTLLGNPYDWEITVQSYDQESYLPVQVTRKEVNFNRMVNDERNAVEIMSERESLIQWFPKVVNGG